MKVSSIENLEQLIAYLLGAPPTSVRRFLSARNCEWESLTRKAIASLGRGEPLSYALGGIYFRNRWIASDRRACAVRPYCELFVQKALECALPLTPHVLEMGCGAGAMIISIALELSQGEFLAVDIDRDALNLSRENASRLGASVTFVESDLFDKVKGHFDLIVASLPYEQHPRGDTKINFEPQTAIYDGSSNRLGLMKRFLKGCCSALLPSGHVVIDTPEWVEQVTTIHGQPIFLPPDNELIGFVMSAPEVLATIQNWNSD